MSLSACARKPFLEQWLPKAISELSFFNGRQYKLQGQCSESRQRHTSLSIQ